MITDKRAIQAILNGLYEQGYRYIRFYKNHQTVIYKGAPNKAEEQFIYKYLCFDINLPEDKLIEIKQKPLPQSTYMHDINGCEIFVGDKINYEDTDGRGNWFRSEERVIFDRNSFVTNESYTSIIELDDVQVVESEW